MRKKLVLDKELVTSTDQIVGNFDGASPTITVTFGPPCVLTACYSCCFETYCTCSILEE